MPANSGPSKEPTHPFLLLGRIVNNVIPKARARAELNLTSAMCKPRQRPQIAAGKKRRRVKLRESFYPEPRQTEKTWQKRTAPH